MGLSATNSPALMSINTTVLKYTRHFYSKTKVSLPTVSKQSFSDKV